mgnify:CR=1 FL=1
MNDSGMFISPTKGEMDLETVIQEIALFVAISPNSAHKVIIGTDSQNRRNALGPYIDYVTAIVVHRIGHGGRYFWQRHRHHGAKFYLRDRIYREVTYSLDIASKFVPILRTALNGGNYELEIHIDVGSVGPTRELIKEVVGMVTGNGYTAKTKPASYGASSIADRHT